MPSTHASAVASRRGFSLVELMVGFGVLALLFGGAFATLTQGNKIIENSRDFTRVSQILQSEMESLRARNWDQITALPTRDEFDPDPRFAAVFKDRYRCIRLLRDNPTKAGQKLVTVIAVWTDSFGRRHDRRYTTIISQNGISDYFVRSFGTTSGT